MPPKRLKPSELAAYRAKLSASQGKKCGMTGVPLTRPVLDHDHSSGFCRSVLQREVNSFEGVVFRAWKRYIRHLGIDFQTALESLAEYHRRDFSSNPLHPTHKTEDEKAATRRKKARKAYRAKRAKKTR